MLDRRLQHVVAVGQTGSFSKAGEQVGLTQSAVTRSVADLERELGYAVFYRTARGAALTELGRDFVERAGQLLEDARHLMKGGAEQGDPFARPLRIGVSPASLEWLLADPLAALLSRHPSVRITLAGSTFERVVQLLRTGGVDVAVGFDDAFAEWSDLTRTPAGALGAILFVRRGHPILAIRGLSRADLAGFDFVAPSDSRPYGAIIRSLFDDQGVQWQRHLHTIDNFTIVRRLVATSDTIGVATEEYTHTAAFNAGFERVPIDGPFAPTPLCCAVRSRSQPPAPVRAFLKVMRPGHGVPMSESHSLNLE